MDFVKFNTEVTTLKKFFECYCHNKHEGQKSINKHLTYKNESMDIDLDLCDECLERIEYSIDRLLGCPHEIKPRCRACPDPCYEKQKWKEVAKVMRYSGVTLGISRMNKKIKSLFKKNEA